MGSGVVLGNFLGNNCLSLRPSRTVWTGCTSKNVQVRWLQTAWTGGCQRFRKPTLYPLSYGGWYVGQRGD
jgi:hypothetical protein